MEHLLEEREEVVRGVVRRVTFRNPENGYSVIQLAVPEVEGQITVVGTSRTAAVGSHLVVRGVYSEHPKFGRQLAARSITEAVPTSAEGLKNYLGSGLIKGIGAGTAEKIVELFGDKTLEMIHRDPERVAKIPGVGKRRAELLHEALKERESTREIEQFLIEHHIGVRLAQRIFEKYRSRAIEVITKDPYLLARSMRGVGFMTADSIAMNLGFKPDSPQRLTAGLYYALEKAADDGHCHLSGDELVLRARALLGLDESYDLEPALEQLLREGTVVRRDGALLLDHIERAESFCAEFVADRIPPYEHPQINPLTVERALRAAADSLGVTFTPDQREAVHNAVKFPISIITGGPGCGKTTIIRALAFLFREANRKLVLAAPTGRAAQRMAQVCELPAGTIHRLLKFDPSTGGFRHGIDDPLMADAVIIDEASMIDIHLARALFSAIPRGAPLILVGDKDQLPSVGPGRVFGDLVSLKEIKITGLSQLFRRAEGSSINDVAHLVNCGTPPEIPEPDGETKTDAYFIPRKDPEEAAALVEKLLADQLPKKFGFTAGDITVLTPSNRGPLGTLALNKRLQERLNPAGAIDAEQEIRLNDFTLRLNDRVCQRVNNYNLDDIGVFNGDAGRVHQVERATRSVWVELWDGRLIQYKFDDLSQLSLAYAITVHRSQGSEMPCVVLVLHDSHYTLLERQLIYTAITRAKKLLIVVGSKRALHIACKRMSGHRRHTLLASRIRSLLDGRSERELLPSDPG